MEDSSFRALTARGTAEYGKGEFAAAKTAYLECLRQKPESSTIRSNLSATELRLQNYPAALAYALSVVEKRPKWPKGLWRLFDVLRSFDDTDDEFKMRNPSNATLYEKKFNPKALAALRACVANAGDDQNAKRYARELTAYEALQRRCTVPVILLSGFLGSGKTTLMNLLLRRTHGDTGTTRNRKKILVLVNDMSSVNVDASLIVHASESMVELTNGCICCTLKDDLQRELVHKLSSDSFEVVLIESTGISEPLPVAQALTVSASYELQALVRLHKCVTVLDAVEFEHTFSREFVTLKDKRWELNEQDSRSLNVLLYDQLEAANVVVVNKIDAFPDEARAEDVRRVCSIVRATNDRAQIVSTSLLHESESTENLCSLLLGSSSSFDVVEEARRRSWRKELEVGSNHVSEMEEYDLKSLTWRPEDSPYVDASAIALGFPSCEDDAHRTKRRRRRTDEREALSVGLGEMMQSLGVIRSKGYVVLKQDPRFVVKWATVGGAGSIAPHAARTRIPTKGKNEETYLVCIGQNIDEKKIRDSLDALVGTLDHRDWKVDESHALCEAVFGETYRSMGRIELEKLTRRLVLRSELERYDDLERDLTSTEIDDVRALLKEKEEMDERHSHVHNA